MTNCPFVITRLIGDEVIDYCPQNGMRLCLLWGSSECPELDAISKCPNCGVKLEHFSGLEQIPEYQYCPKCMDWAYDEYGERIARLV